MKKIALLLAVGVPCFLAGVIVSYLWFRSQQSSTTQSSPDSGKDLTLDDVQPAAGAATPVANGKPRASRFAALDTDQDGKLSLAEFSVGRSPTEAAKWFGRRDTDQDGFLSSQEFLPTSAGSER